MNAEGGTRNAERQVESAPPRDLKERTKAFAVDIIRLVEHLPRGRAAEIIGKQLVRSGTSVAANYRAARRARSRKEFLAKMGIVEEEADESAFWLELLVDVQIAAPSVASRLRAEASQLVAITVSSIRTARGPRVAVPRSAFRIPRSALDVH
ncbi:MAG: four helix bundle protein [Gemmatimonadales bacterium]|nr:four helix bundle protein [Gemmatimonadales bacterium]